MGTIKFNKTECGVEVLLNVLSGAEVKAAYWQSGFYKADIFEIVLFRKAKGSLVIDRQKVELTDNSIIFISAHQRRNWEADPCDLEFTSLVFQEEFLNDFFADKYFTYRLQYFYQSECPLKMGIEDEELDKYCGILQEIKDELTVNKPDSQHIIRSLLYYLLQTLNRRYVGINGLPMVKESNGHAFQFKKLLESHIREKQRVNDYAEIMGISRISLNKAVQMQFGVTATQMVKQRLLFEIQNMLIYSGKSVGEIAFELNFSETHHLMRFFKSQTGQTISEYCEGYYKRTVRGK